MCLTEEVGKRWNRFLLVRQIQFDRGCNFYSEGYEGSKIIRIAKYINCSSLLYIGMEQIKFFLYFYRLKKEKYGKEYEADVDEIIRLLRGVVNRQREIGES